MFEALTLVPDAERGFDWIFFGPMKLKAAMFFFPDYDFREMIIWSIVYPFLLKFASNQMLLLNNSGKIASNMSHLCNCGCAASCMLFS